MKKPSLRSPLGKARNHGSAKNGTGHFIHQRVTAVALIPLSLWFIASIICSATSGNPAALQQWLASGVHASLLALMLFAMFYHAKLGVQVVIEDYLHCECVKMGALLANTFFMYGAAVLSIVAVLKLHLHM